MQIKRQITGKPLNVCLLLFVLFCTLFACKPDLIVETEHMDENLSRDTTSPYLSTAVLNDFTTDIQLTLTFNESVEPSTVSLNRTTTSCTGMVQLSQDRFTTCLPITGDAVFVSTNDSIILALGSISNFRTQYQVKITRGIEDTAGNPLASEKTLDFKNQTAFRELAVALDTDYNGTGVAIVGNFSGDDLDEWPINFYLDPDGRVLLTGYVKTLYRGYDLDMFLTRLTEDGQLDDTFSGPRGYTTYHNAAGGDNYDAGNSLVTDDAGNIYVIGMSVHGEDGFNGQDLVLWRYKSNGSLDTSFNSKGYVIHDNAAGGNGSDQGYDILIDRNGKILVSGASYSATDHQLAIWRFNADGSLDTSFNGQGFLTWGNTGAEIPDHAQGMIIDQNHKIVVCGYATTSTGYTEMAIWRFNEDGTLDTTFNAPNGYVTYDSAAGGRGWDAAYDIAIDFSSRILVSGHSYNGVDEDLVIWRYNSDGTLDTTFNAPHGFYVFDSRSGNDYGYGLEILADGHIMVAGLYPRDTTDSGVDWDAGLWRFNSDGTLDTTFNAPHGYIHYHNAAGGDGNDTTGQIIIDGQGRVLLAGSSAGKDNLEVVVWRIK